LNLRPLGYEPNPRITHEDFRDEGSDGRMGIAAGQRPYEASTDVHHCPAQSGEACGQTAVKNLSGVPREAAYGVVSGTRCRVR